MAGRKVIVGSDEFGNPSEVALSGSNSVISIVSALAITDTNAHYFNGDLSAYGDATLLVSSTLDQSATVALDGIAGIGSHGYVQEDTTGTTQSMTAPGPHGNVQVWKPFAFTTTFDGFIKCGTAPTTGSITIAALVKGAGL